MINDNSVDEIVDDCLFIEEKLYKLSNNLSDCIREIELLRKKVNGSAYKKVEK